MKKIILAVVVCMAVVLGGCKEKLVSTTYRIGCLDFQYSASNVSGILAIEEYLKANVEFNKLVTFEGHTQSENDAQAIALYENQIAKVDKDFVCSQLHEAEYYVYGIGTKSADGEYHTLKGTKFTSTGVEEVQD